MYLWWSLCTSPVVKSPIYKTLAATPVSEPTTEQLFDTLDVGCTFRGVYVPCLYLICAWFMCLEFMYTHAR